MKKVLETIAKVAAFIAMSAGGLLFVGFVLCIVGAIGSVCIMAIKDFGLFSIWGVIGGLVLTCMVCGGIAGIYEVIHEFIKNNDSDIEEDAEKIEDNEDTEEIAEFETSELPMTMTYEVKIPQYQLSIDLENTTILIKVPIGTKVEVEEI